MPEQLATPAADEDRCALSRCAPALVTGGLQGYTAS